MDVLDERAVMVRDLARTAQRLAACHDLEVPEHELRQVMAEAGALVGWWARRVAS